MPRAPEKAFDPDDKDGADKDAKGETNTPRPDHY